MSEDFSRTLNDVMSGYQGMSATISHFGGPAATPHGSMMSSQAEMQNTPPPPTPTMTIQPPPPPPPTPAFDPMMGMSQAANQPFQTATAPPMGGVAAGMQQGMAQAQSYNMNPMYAAYMDPSMNMASAGYMTPARAGVFRQAPVADFRQSRPVGVGGQRVPDAMIPFSPGLTRHTPMPQFSRGYDAAMYVGSEQARLLQQGTAGYAEAAAGTLVGAGGAYAGAGLGAGIGGFFGGIGGAKLGAEVGMVAGSFAQYIPGVVEGTEAAFRPAIERRADAIRSQFASRQFMVGASGDLDISGQGLSTSASQQMTRDFDQMADASGGSRTRRDFIDIMQAGGEQGLMDLAQNKDQIVDTVKQLSQVVGTFAEITGDPDFRNNIQKIGQLRRLGIGVGEMQQAVTNMDQYARMAGMDVDQLMQTQGMQGAGIYQGSGLVAGQGLQTGMMTGGQARQMVASGAINERDMALYGGASGMSQRMTEMNAAFLSNTAQPLLPYFATEGEDGRLSINKDRVAAFRRGDISYEDALRESSKMEMSDSARQRIMGFRGRELTAELGESLGPEGTQRAMVQAIMSIQKDNPNLDIMTAAELAAGPDGAAMLSRMGNKKYQEGVLGQMGQELDRRRFDARQGGGALESRGFMSMIGLRGVDPLGGVQESVSDYLANYEESKRLEAVGTTRFQRDAPASASFKANNLGGADISTALGTLGIQGNVSAGGQSAFAEYAQPFTSDFAAYQREVTGTGMFDQTFDIAGKLVGTGGILSPVDSMEVLGELADEGFGAQGIQKRARRMMDINVKTGSQSAKERTDARGSLLERVGEEEYAKIMSRMTRKISDKNKFNVGEYEILSDTEMAASLGPGLSMADVSTDELAALQHDAATNLGSQEDQTGYLSSLNKKTSRARTASIGEEFMRGGGTGALNEALDSIGFGDIEDMGDADKLAMEALTSYADADYLVLAAAETSANSMFGGATGSGAYRKALQKRDGMQAYDKKKAAATKYFASLPLDVREAIMERVPTLINEKSHLSRAQGGMRTENFDPTRTKERLGAVGDIGGATAAVEGRQKISAVLDDMDVSTGDSTKELVTGLRNTTSTQQKELREKGYGSLLDMVTDEDFDAASEEDMLKVNTLLSGMNPGELDVKDDSATSKGVREQEEAIESQRKFFSTLNVAMSGNSQQLQSNTAAVVELTKALQGTSKDELEKGKGNKPQDTDPVR